MSLDAVTSVRKVGAPHVRADRLYEGAPVLHHLWRVTCDFRDLRGVFWAGVLCPCLAGPPLPPVCGSPRAPRSCDSRPSKNGRCLLLHTCRARRVLNVPVFRLMGCVTVPRGGQLGRGRAAGASGGTCVQAGLLGSVPGDSLSHSRGSCSRQGLGPAGLPSRRRCCARANGCGLHSCPVLHDSTMKLAQAQIASCCKRPSWVGGSFPGSRSEACSPPPPPRPAPSFSGKIQRISASSCPRLNLFLPC